MKRFSTKLFTAGKFYDTIQSVINMRLRRMKNLETRKENCSELLIPYELESLDRRDVNNKQYYNFKEIFGNDNPIVLEIGCGRGQFACEYAKCNPDKNIIGVECVAGVLVSACEKAQTMDLPNLRFWGIKAEYLPVFIKENSVAEIYLNFSTPFPKVKYEKHRLTHPDYLNIYNTILCEDGFIAQKTDNQQLFEYSIESFSQNGFSLSEVSLDLHKSTFEGNIVTEYEQKFSEKGMPIYRLVARKTR